jgi:hypothetical protein
MKKSLQITLKDKSVIAIDAIVKTTHEPLILVKQLFEKKNSPLLLIIKHQQLNTFLELSKVSPFVLLYFNADNFFSGATYSINEYGSSFNIQTQYKNILLIPLTSNHEVNYLLNSSFLEIIQPDNDQEDQIKNWKLTLNGYSNEMLVDTINQQIGNIGWTNSRANYLDCLKEEIKNRNFESDIIFEFNKNNIIIAFKLSKKVKLEANKLIFI